MPTDLASLCVIVGCLNRRVDSNQCARHERMSGKAEDRMSDAEWEEAARQTVAAERVARADAKHAQILAKGTAREEGADALATRLLLLASLEGAVAQSIRDTKELLSARMTVGDLKRPEIGGVAAGSVTYAHGAESASVTDEAALVAYVERHYTTELELRMTVREAFLSAILEASKAAGQPAMPDGTLGVPGVSVARGKPRIVARPDKAHAAELWLEARANPLRLITSQEQP